MGQYHVTVNLDKKQFIDPHKLGNGLKLLEQTGGSGGVGSALLVLLAVSNNRGGGDIHEDHEMIGSWGGDRIAVVGDYAENGDLRPEDEATQIWSRCVCARGEDCEHDWHYTDITDDLKPLLERAFEVCYVGTGWQRCFSLWEIPGWEYSAGINPRYGSVNGQKYRIEDIIAEVKRMVEADNRGGFGVELASLDISRLNPVQV